MKVNGTPSLTNLCAILKMTRNVFEYNGNDNVKSAPNFILKVEMRMNDELNEILNKNDEQCDDLVDILNELYSQLIQGFSNVMLAFKVSIYSRYNMKLWGKYLQNTCNLMQRKCDKTRIVDAKVDVNYAQASVVLKNAQTNDGDVHVSMGCDSCYLEPKHKFSCRFCQQQVWHCRG